MMNKDAVPKSRTLASWFRDYRAIAVRPLRRLAWRIRRRLAGVLLERHVVVCGFPRSGTTLLQLMLETAMPGSHVFGKESSAILTAYSGMARTLITKRPDDLYDIDRIRKCYQGSSVQVRFVVVIRDPRDVLTSMITAISRTEYYVSCERWLALYEHYRKLSVADDVLVARYEDLVTDCDAMKSLLEGFFNVTCERPLDYYVNNVPEKFMTVALNGVRRPDQHGIGRWRDPQHAERIQEVLSSLPAFPEYLIDMKYELDSNWVRAAMPVSADDRAVPS